MNQGKHLLEPASSLLLFSLFNLDSITVGGYYYHLAVEENSGKEKFRNFFFLELGLTVDQDPAFLILGLAVEK